MIGGGFSKDVFGKLRCYANRSVRHLFSVYHWVVLIKRLEMLTAPSEFATPYGERIIFREATASDCTALIDAYPDEFSSYLTPELIKKRILGRQTQGVPCFLALNSDNRICGATWCPPYRDEVLKIAGIGADRVFEMMNTFVVSRYRAQGVGGALRRFALNKMTNKGYRAVISFVWYSRQESLAMNFATGSQLLGEKRQLTILGWRTISYGHRVDLSRLPLPQKPGVLVAGQSRLHRRSVGRCFRRWGLKVIEFDTSSEKKRGKLKRYLEETKSCCINLPLLFCYDSVSRELLEKIEVESKPERILPFQNSDLPTAIEVVSGNHVLAEAICDLDGQRIGLPGLLYLIGLGRPELIRLWSFTVKT